MVTGPGKHLVAGLVGLLLCYMGTLCLFDRSAFEKFLRLQKWQLDIRHSSGVLGKFVDLLLGISLIFMGTVLFSEIIADYLAVRS